MWAGLLLVLSAAVGLVSLVLKVTSFTSQIFEFIIVITCIYSALHNRVALFWMENATEDTVDLAVFAET